MAFTRNWCHIQLIKVLSNLPFLFLTRNEHEGQEAVWIGKDEEQWVGSQKKVKNDCCYVCNVKDIKNYLNKTVTFKTRQLK